MTMTDEQKARWRAAIKPLVLEMHREGMPFAELVVLDIKNVSLRLSADPMGDGEIVDLTTTPAPRRTEGKRP